MSKLSNLIFLKKKIKNINIPDFKFYSIIEFDRDFFKIINYICNFKYDVILRSSSADEDTESISNAGKYESLVIKKSKKKNKNKLIEKIKKFRRQFKFSNDQIIIQKYISKVDSAGVVFTEDKNLSSPYYIINYESSGKTDGITSGSKKKNQLLIIYKYYDSIPFEFKKLVKIIKKIEEVSDYNRLDIEFCIKKKNIYILQCRKLYFAKSTNFKINKVKFKNILDNIKKKVNKILHPNPFLHGKRNLLSNMADWNPAEIIGDKPNSLAISLYATLITNEMWSKHRSLYGYKNVYPNPLMYNLGGSPYIDVRCDLNSFLPKDLNKKISEKVIKFSIQKLVKKPFLHDKVEFEIIETCFNFNFHKDLKKSLGINYFNEYKKSLLKLTNDILNKKSKTLINESKKSIELLKKFYQIVKSKNHPINKIYWLVHYCKELGILPFAGAARCAFISTKILRSLKEIKLISEDELKKIYLNLDITTSKINIFLKRIIQKKETIFNFKKNFGHLRPELYNIESKNYKNNFSLYFKNYKYYNFNKTKYSINFEKKKEINKLFKKIKFALSFDEFIDFAINSIELREEMKFNFSKLVDEIFNQLTILAKEINLKFSDLKFLDISTILYFYNNLDQEKIRYILKKQINENKKKYKQLKLIKLPDLIIKSNDIFIQKKIPVKENYITNKIVESAEVVELDNKKIYKPLKNKIIFIKNADPGYDFIFNHGIKGLITAYGGTNSHMAIRCLEQSVPAAIGIGLENYNNLKNKNKIYLNCEKKLIKYIS